MNTSSLRTTRSHARRLAATALLMAGGLGLGVAAAPAADATVYGSTTGWAQTFVGCDVRNHSLRIVDSVHGNRSYSTNSSYGVMSRIRLYTYSTGTWEVSSWGWRINPGDNPNTIAVGDETSRVPSGRYLVYFDYAFGRSDGQWDMRSEYANSDNRSQPAQYGTYRQYSTGAIEGSCRT
jgi:hypothetical protein